MVPRVRAVPAPTQQLSHALAGTAAPSRHMSVVAPVTAPLANSSGHGLSGKKSFSPQGAKGKEATEIDNNDLGHLSYGLEQNNIDDDLSHLTIVRDNHDLASDGDRMQENWPHSSTNPSVSSGAGGGRTLTGRSGLDGTPAAEPGGQAPGLVPYSRIPRVTGMTGQWRLIMHALDNRHWASG